LSIFLCSSPAWATWTIVTSTGNSTGSATGAVISATKTLVNVGDLLVVAASYATNSTTNLTLDSALGNSLTSIGQKNWDTIASPTSGTNIWYGKITTTGSEAITIHGNAAASFRVIYFLEYSGNSSGTSLDKSDATASDSDANPLNGTAIVTTQNGELVVVVGNQTAGTGTLTAGTGYTLQLTNGNGATVLEDQTQASAGSITGSFANSSTGQLSVVYTASFFAPPPPPTQQSGVFIR